MKRYEKMPIILVFTALATFLPVVLLGLASALGFVSMDAVFWLASKAFPVAAFLLFCGLGSLFLLILTDK